MNADDAAAAPSKTLVARIPRPACCILCVVRVFQGYTCLQESLLSFIVMPTTHEHTRRADVFHARSLFVGGRRTAVALHSCAGNASKERALCLRVSAPRSLEFQARSSSYPYHRLQYSMEVWHEVTTLSSAATRQVRVLTVLGTRRMVRTLFLRPAACLKDGRPFF